MTRILRRATGGALRLESEFRRSGEGSIWRCEDEHLVAKLYHAPLNTAQRRKLQLMIAHPPRDPTLAAGHRSLAWPVDLLLDANDQTIGFVMPAIRDSVTLINVANPTLRKKHTRFNWRYLLRAAANIAAVFEAVHRAGYVIGDVKDANVLINRQALPALVDCDSFQVRRFWRTHLCPVGTAGYTPPEAIGIDFTRVPRRVQHDRFGLAMVIHLLLVGDSPFSGRWCGEDDPPDINQLIKHGQSRYHRGSPLVPVARQLPLQALPPRLRRLIKRALLSGLNRPRKRPSAAVWRRALTAAGNELRICDTNPWHHYHAGLRHCPWCALHETSGADPFPLPAGLDLAALREEARTHNATQTAQRRRRFWHRVLLIACGLLLISASLAAWRWWPATSDDTALTPAPSSDAPVGPAGTLTITCALDALLFLDGDLVQVLAPDKPPMAPLPLPPGTHEIAVKVAGRTIEESITVNQHSTWRLEIGGTNTHPVVRVLAHE